MIYESALCMLFPKLITPQKLLLKHCIYQNLNTVDNTKHYQKLRKQCEDYRETLMNYHDSIRYKRIQYANLIELATRRNYRVRNDDVLRSTLIKTALENMGIDWKLLEADFFPNKDILLIDEKLNPTVCKLIDQAEIKTLAVIADALQESESLNHYIIDHLVNCQHYTGCWAFRVLRELRQGKSIKNWKPEL